MDSTNSGSNQSSSSGDNEEFDDDAVGSRADLSSFLNLLPSHPPPPVNTSFSSSIFDSFSPYFAPFPFPPPPEAAPLSLQASSAWSSLPPPLPPSPPPPPPPLLSAPSQPPPPRGAKKRTRASRRAPTTVINTEASNFRAMVQQFTGFPTPPFAAAVAAPFPARSRLDLFGAAAAGVVPPFLLRPSAHNMIPSPLSSSSSSSVASFFDRTISPPSHFATTVSATADSSNAIPPKYRGHDKFNLSLLNDDMQRQRGGAAAASFDAPPPPPFLQPPRSQMAALPQFPTDSGGAMNPGWDVEPEQAVEEPTASKILIRNFQNNQS
ncbi:hypothetical protein ZIOFF_020544 [Zingiber officinale]|uniref:VQ domain-containing protein n=1 Tax=Zingiber officinale TaxID=94328 RepID=A0A8J5GZZ0_ZINOF|nr:hypothetical protein ZIOFF_020544 [Zingiber officinale]